MNNLIPPELQDLTESKKRVMRNVVNEIEQHSTRPKHSWRYTVIAALLFLCALTFVLNTVKMEEEPSAFEQHVDFEKPTLSAESGVFYLNGLTIGESKPQVIEAFGEDFTIVQEEDSEADLIMDFDGRLRVYFEGDVVSKITFLNVDKSYFDKLFNEYRDFKFFYTFAIDPDHYFYMKETNQIVEARNEPMGENLTLSLFTPDSYLKEKADFLFTMDQKIKLEDVTPSDQTIDFKKPSVAEKDGSLYLQGITFGDSLSKVVEQFGGDYLIGYSDGGESPSDFVIESKEQATVFFYGEKVDWFVLKDIDKEYFNELFAAYDGLKLVNTYGGNYENPDRFIYSKDSGLLLKATTNTPNEELYLYLLPVGKDLLDDPNLGAFEVVD